MALHRDQTGDPMLIGLTWIFSTVGLVLVRLGFFGGLLSPAGRIVFLVCGVAWLGTGYYMVSAQQQKAITAGFESSQDRRDAKKAGFTDAEAWKVEKLKRTSEGQK